MCWLCTPRRPRNHRRRAFQRKLRESGIGVRVSGSRGWLREHRPRGPCPGNFDCMCDLHEGVTAHRKSRAVASRVARREIREQLDA